MTKTGLLLYLGALFVYCRRLAPVVGNDVPVYLAALACSLLALRTHRLRSKAFLFNFLFIQGMTTWLCHVFLDPGYRLITDRLVYVKGLMLGVFLLLEVLAAAHLIRRYLLARRRNMFASDALAHALGAFPMPPQLNRVFRVEFNIWRALLVRVGLLKDRDGEGMTRIGRIEAGYGPGLTAAVAIALPALNALCIFFLPPLWYIAPLLGSVYVALLLHCELMVFGRHAIYADRDMLRIPNGIDGFVAVERSTIASVSLDAPALRPDLNIARLQPANLHLRLTEAINIADTPVLTVSLCVPEASRKALAAFLAEDSTSAATPATHGASVPS